MHWFAGLTSLVGLLGSVSAGPLSLAPRADSSVYRDAETGFTFSEYAAQFALGQNTIYRIAIPSPATGAFDVVLQVVSPNGVGWTGLAWGGKMPNNPLMVAWPNGQSSVVSSRTADGHVAPKAYTGATYTVFRKGTRSNGTHWQFTAKCSGCTSFSGTTLTATGSNRLAFAYSASRPSSPSQNTSTIPVHDSHNYWNHDFSSAGNANFATLVQQNQ